MKRQGVRGGLLRQYSRQPALPQAQEQHGDGVTAQWSPDQLERGRLLFAGPASFVMGVAQIEQLPAVRGIEIAFAGRSNAGKSTLINALTGHNDLARASNTPGRTRELNFFDIGQGRLTLVDMPGYGYAKAPKNEVKKWQGLLKTYLRGRPGLTRVFVLIDSRHGVTKADEEMFGLLDESAVDLPARAHQVRQDRGPRRAGASRQHPQPSSKSAQPPIRRCI